MNILTETQIAKIAEDTTGMKCTASKYDWKNALDIIAYTPSGRAYGVRFRFRDPTRDQVIRGATVLMDEMKRLGFDVPIAHDQKSL